MNINWFLVVNPTAGNGNFKKQWKTIKSQLANHHVAYVYENTSDEKREKEIVVEAIIKGHKKFLSVGGDGTLHHIVNAIMNQTMVSSTDITVGVIPLGTGNDWIKTYNIPNNISKAIKIIAKNSTIYQDIGILETADKTYYFNNIAGIGYDAYVVKQLQKLKHFGSIAYLLSGLYGLLLYKKEKYTIEIDNTVMETKSLMTVFGICKYSGGGMLLTDFENSSDGYLAVTVVKNLTFFELITNVNKLYKGTLINHRKVITRKTKEIKVSPILPKHKTYIQADGELIGIGTVKVSLLKQALQFIVP